MIEALTMKQKRQEAIKKELSCEFIRINKKLTKKSLIDKVSQRLLELEFKSNHLIKSKCLKLSVKNIFPTI